MTAGICTNITQHAQLFLDDSWIEDCAFVERVWHQPRKFRKPLIEPEFPWEDLGLTCYGSIRQWRGKFRAWYTTWPRRRAGVICYAESEDGIHWTKPELDLHPFGEYARTNIVLVSDAWDDMGKVDDLNVFIDEDDDEWPLKMIYWDSGRSFGKREPQPPPYGFYLARSKDGIAWDKQGVVFEGAGDRFNAIPDKWRGEYVLFMRGNILKDRTTMRQRGRSVFRTASPDLRNWSEPELILSSGTEDPVNMEYYSLTAYPYEGLLMGAIERFHSSPDYLDCELTWSTDSRTWHRTRRRNAFLPWGPPGAFDDQWAALTSSPPILVDGRLWYYYSGRSEAHNLPYPHGDASIGLATLRRDGFCSIRAAERAGYVLTPPMEWPDADLLVNMDCRLRSDSHPSTTTGDLYVEAVDAEGRSLPGFARKECDLWRVNTARVNKEDPERAGYFGTTYAQGTRSLRQLAGRTIRLKFHLHEAHLYGFRAGTWEESCQ